MNRPLIEDTFPELDESQLINIEGIIISLFVNLSKTGHYLLIKNRGGLVRGEIIDSASGELVQHAHGWALQIAQDVFADIKNDSIVK